MEPLSMETSTMEKMLLSRAAASQRPLNGSLELLPLCNMNCDMCYVSLSREEMERQGRLRTADEWLEIGRQMKDAGVLFLLLTGGEPFLYPDFKRLYLGLRQMGMILTINTNGTLIDEDLGFRGPLASILCGSADPPPPRRSCPDPRRSCQRL